MTRVLVRVAAAFALLLARPASADVVDELLAKYAAQGAKSFSATAGAAFWVRPFPDLRGGAARSCASCHTRDLRARGEIGDTGESIEPLKPAVNPKRLTDAAFVERWLKRGCRWTLGRECTPQEKGSVLLFIRE